MLVLLSLFWLGCHVRQLDGGGGVDVVVVAAVVVRRVPALEGALLASVPDQCHSY